MSIKELNNKYKFTIKDLFKTLDNHGMMPKGYIEVKKQDVEKTKKLSRK